ncbi:MAG: hypothetical protein QJR09_08235 [Micrococcus sp.]|nr:hypothetical protein [Micrococcus sp.]
MAWRYDLVDSRTGEKIAVVEPAEYEGGTLLNDATTGSVGLNFAHLDLAQARAYVADAHPVKSLIVQSWVDAAHPDGFAVSAGYIGPREREPGAWAFTASTHDLWWMLDRRTAIGPLSTNPAESRYLIEKSSFANYVRRLLEIADNNSESSDVLPLILPPEGTGPRKWDIRGHESPIIGQLIRDVCNEGSGPDVWFQPVWRADATFAWQAHVSTALNRSLSFEVQLGADRSNAFDLGLTEDLSLMANRVFVAGEGEGRAKKMGSAVDASTGYPTMERIVTDNQVKSVEQARRVAAGVRDAGLAPIMELSMKIRAEGVRDLDGNVVPGTGVTALRPGMTIRLFMNDDDPFLPAGEVIEARLAGYSTDDSENITLHTW